ncbi:hypothetical protein DYH09_04620 [bacterium CPR1]|nr:hypothetical protein [bacterium CPR1]
MRVHIGASLGELLDCHQEVASTAGLGHVTIHPGPECFGHPALIGMSRQEQDSGRQALLPNQANQPDGVGVG